MKPKNSPNFLITPLRLSIDFDAVCFNLQKWLAGMQLSLMTSKISRLSSRNLKLPWL